MFKGDIYKLEKNDSKGSSEDKVRFSYIHNNVQVDLSNGNQQLKDGNA